MEFLSDLWLPIVLSAVLVFVVSSILHMVVPIHKEDCKQLANEDDVRAALRPQRLPPGMYAFPRPASMKDMCSPEMIAKYKEGPVGLITMMRNEPPSMGKSLTQWFLFCIAVGVFVAYAAWHALSPGAEYLSVFRQAGTIAIVGYSLSPIVESIWKGQPWSTTLKFVFDGVLYGLTTAGTFAWLWPEAVAA